MKNLIKKILKEDYTVRKPEVGDIYKSDYGSPNTLVLVDGIVNKNDAGRKTLDTVRGMVTINHDGYYLNYKTSHDGGKTWKYPDNDPHYYAPVKWIEHIIKNGRWVLVLPNTDFFGQLEEQEEDFSWLKLPNLPKGDSYIEKVRYALLNTEFELRSEDYDKYYMIFLHNNEYENGNMIRQRSHSFRPEIILPELREVITNHKSEWYHPFYEKLYNILIQIK